MKEHSAKILEFDIIKNRIAKHSFIESNIAYINELMPSNYTINELIKEFDITRDFIELFEFDDGLDLAGIKDLNEILKKLDIFGTFLEIEEIFYINSNFKKIHKFKSIFEEHKDKYRFLYSKFINTPTYKGLEDIFSKAIEDESSISDNASPELKIIRHKKKSISEQIKRKLNEIISNPINSKAIQEKIITSRDGREVIPIKNDFRGQIKGVEHDRSSSGQTVFIEPLAILPLNNKLKELEKKEKEEIRKILIRLTDLVRVNIDGIRKISDSICYIDFLHCKMLYSLNYKCNIPNIVNKLYVNLKNARHPLIHKNDVVPLSFSVGKNYNILLITGPNTGGKTVALKTAGLFTLLALSGIPIPADETSEIGYFNGIYADIGDEQSIEQSLSSFSSHLTNIQKILSAADKNSLILLDELGSGTDPVEGAAFAMSVIDYLKSKKIKSIISTHYSEVKAHGYNLEKVETASMEFDHNTLSPTYKLLLGVPGESNALLIASKIGFFPEIIENARAYISDEYNKVEKMITNIKEQSKELEEKNKEVDILKEEALKKKNDYQNMLNLVKLKENEIIKEAYKRSEDIIKNNQAKAKALIDKINKDLAKKEDLKKAQKNLLRLQEAIIEDKKKNVISKKPKKMKITFREGESVFVKSLNQNCMILRINHDKEKVQVQAGILKLMVDLDDIQTKVKKSKTFSSYTGGNYKKISVSMRIDLRGKYLEDAIHELDRYISRALLSGHSSIEIVHGKGTGALRKGVHDYLKHSKNIKNYYIASQNQGGLGCTIAELK